MDRDSDGDIKMKFDDDGEVSSYIKTRDVWVLVTGGASSVSDISGAVSLIKSTLGDVCSTWPNAGWDGEDEYSTSVRSGLERGPTESNPCIVAKGLSDSRATELLTALAGTPLSSRHGLQAKRMDGSQVAVFLGTGSGSGGGGRPSVGDKVKLTAGYRGVGDAAEGPLEPGMSHRCAVSCHHTDDALVLLYLTDMHRLFNCGTQATLAASSRMMAALNRSG
jgi:hypothetical protein